MARPSPRPTGHIRTFGHDEVIVSKTDLRGHITYVNHTFVEVSAYPESELIGQPHNIIRHPEMPRGLFHLLWERLRAGQEVFAFINNLAADGASYWVLAHLTASCRPDGSVVGYHSNRRSPAAAAVAEVDDLYRRMRAAEHGSAQAAAHASRAVLEDFLAARGTTYDEYVWDVIDRTERVAA